MMTKKQIAAMYDWQWLKRKPLRDLYSNEFMVLGATAGDGFYTLNLNEEQKFDLYLDSLGSEIADYINEYLPEGVELIWQ